MAIAAVGQLCSTASMIHNLHQCRILIRKASLAGAKALFLPEATDYIASSAAETISLVRPVESSPFVLGLQEEAKSHNLAINVGIHEPTGPTPSSSEVNAERKKVRNTSIWISPKGEITHRYQKIHLFDVDIKGGPVLKESDSVEKGMSILSPFETAVGRVGLMNCFDLRFPEISLALRRQNAHLLTYPSAFTIPTGHAHWSTLLRARAIETQAYVLAAAQVGAHNDKRVSYGHSMIVDPWGKVVGELGGEWKGEPELLVVDVDLAYLEKVRKEMPLLRRTDVYPEL